VSDEQSKPEPAPAPATGERMALPSWDRGRTKKRGAAGPGDDAFQAGVKQVGRGAAQRGRLVALGVGVATIAVVVGVVVYDRGQKASAAATRTLTQAVTYEARAEVGDPALLLGPSKRRPTAPVVKDEAERAAAVEKALTELSAQAGGSEAELDAVLVAAARKMRDGKFAEAEAEYRRFLERASAGHPLKWSAREGLGFAREAQDDLEGALAEFKSLAGEKGAFYRDAGLWHQGRILERQGKKDEALAVYRQYIAEYPLSDPSIMQSEVRRRLEELDPSAVAAPAAALPEAAP
jgi:TolA-binding protein